MNTPPPGARSYTVIHGNGKREEVSPDNNQDQVRSAIKEAQRLGVPVAAVVDTNCDPNGITFVVPGNDDALRSIRLFASRMAEAVLHGRGLKESADADAAREAAEAADRLKSAILSNINQEFRTPMTGILGMVGLARRRITDEKVQNYLIFQIK